MNRKGDAEELNAHESRKKRTRPKGYAPWNPRSESRRIVIQVEEILQEYRDCLPMTARQIFYRLVGAFDYPKTERAYTNLCEYLNRARRSGMISFEAIQDDGISVMNADHYAGEDDFYRTIRRLGEKYEQDKLSNQTTKIRIYCEAAV